MYGQTCSGLPILLAFIKMWASRSLRLIVSCCLNGWFLGAPPHISFRWVLLHWPVHHQPILRCLSMAAHPRCQKPSSGDLCCRKWNLSKGESLKVTAERYVLVGLVRSEQDISVHRNCFLVLVAVDENGWRLQVFRQVVDGPVRRAEAYNWNDSIHHKEQ